MSLISTSAIKTVNYVRPIAGNVNVNIKDIPNLQSTLDTLSTGEIVTIK